MKKDKIYAEVATKVNKYIKDKYIHIDGEHPTEEYGVNVVTKAVLREALIMTFEETYKLTKS